LQGWGRALAARVGTKKATMAVARKLAVLLHQMSVAQPSAGRRHLRRPPHSFSRTRTQELTPSP
jgi:hypothetical protein